MMGLTMSQRQAVTEAIATWYKRASRADKGAILDEFCATCCCANGRTSLSRPSRSAWD
jgi:hypothetical protein